jgi:preprotein translocase subunit Sec61beta
MSTKKSGGLKYFSEESSGFKIQPKTVLIMSLIYIGLVVLLHIYAKLGTAKPAVEAPTATPDVETPSAAEQAEPEVQEEVVAEDL